MTLPEAVHAQIAGLIASQPVVLFMKGTRRNPQCGFSARVVQILDRLQPNYRDVDVLASPALRDGIKQFSSWPTIPQLYINGQFVGGCDIVTDLDASGELATLLGASSSGTAPSPALPSVAITPAAAAAFRAALSEGGDEVLHLGIDEQFRNDLYFGAREPGEVEVSSGGLSLWMSPATLRRAAGITIDFVSEGGGAFKISNPNAPARVKELSAPELKALLDRGEVQLFDVRPEAERALARIEAARPLDGAGQEALLSLDRGAAIALHCHHGVRSRHAGEQLLREGFSNVYNLSGGIDAWSQLVDPSVPRY